MTWREEVKLPLLLRHGLQDSVHFMMLLPVGDRFNVNIAEADIGDTCQVESTEEIVRIISKSIIPLRGFVGREFSSISKSLSLAIYGKDISVVFDFMCLNWGDYINDEELIFLVVEKVKKGKRG